MKQKIKIDNFTGKNIVIYCGKVEGEEPDDYIYLKNRESQEIEIDPEWTRMAINEAK